MRILFARHGESTANLTRTFSNRDPWHPLTELGRRQAHELAERLVDEVIGRIVSSPAVRAQETAAIVAESLGAKVEVVEALREFDVGVWEGTDSAEGWAEWRRVVDAWRAGDSDARTEEGESLREITARFEGWLISVGTGLEEHSLLAISHGGLYGAVLPRILAGVEPDVPLNHPLVNCDVVVAEGDGGGFRCLRWGSWTAGLH